MIRSSFFLFLFLILSSLGSHQCFSEWAKVLWRWWAICVQNTCRLHALPLHILSLHHSFIHSFIITVGKLRSNPLWNSSQCILYKLIITSTNADTIPVSLSHHSSFKFYLSSLRSNLQVKRSQFPTLLSQEKQLSLGQTCAMCGCLSLEVSWKETGC